MSHSGRSANGDRSSAVVLRSDCNRRRGLRRQLGPVIGVQRQRMHRILAQPGAQPLDELRAGFAVLVRCREKIALLRRERRDLFRHQPDRLDPIGQWLARKPLAQHVHDVLDAAGRSEALHDRRRPLVLVHEVAAQARDAGAASLQESGELGDQALGGEQQRLGFLDRRRQLDLALIALRRDEQRPRIGQRSARAIDFVEQTLAEAAGDAVAGQCQHVAKRVRADAGERIERRLRVVEQRDRQGRKPSRQIARSARSRSPAPRVRTGSPPARSARWRLTAEKPSSARPRSI